MKKLYLIASVIAIVLPNYSLAEFDGPGYYRVQNTVSNRFITVIGETYNSSTDPDAFEDCVEMLAPGTNNAQITNPGSIIYINSVSQNVRLESQGMDTYQITGTYLKIKTDNLNGETVYIPYITYLFINMYLQDYNGLDPGQGTDYAKYWIKPVNNEGNNYFAVEPNISYNGYYYTTLRTAFNYQLPNGVKAYVIGNNGNAVLYCNPGEIVAKATPVILQCESNLKENNKLLPTTAAAKTVPSTSILVAPIGILSSSISGYSTLPNFFKYTYNAVRNKYVSRGVQRADANYNYRVLGVDESGNVGFYKSFWNEQNGSETNTPISCLDGNRAYLNTSNDVTVLGIPLISPSNSSANVGESISFNVSSTAPSATIYYRLDGEGEWIAVSGNTITITSNQAKNGTVEVKLDNGGIESPIVSADYSFISPVIEKSLAELAGENGINTETKYQISDSHLTIGYYDSNSGIIYAKDDNKSVMKSIISSNQEDYLKKVGLKNANEDWDQSNWIAITIPDKNNATDYIAGTTIKNVIGRLTDLNNLAMIADANPDVDGTTSFVPNLYITANFATESLNHTKYFFVAPKPNEFASITWALWNGTSFVIPETQHGQNEANLNGGFNVVWDLMSKPSFLNSGDAYEIPGAIIKYTGTVPRQNMKIDGGDAGTSQYLVHPVSINSNVITDVTSVSSLKTIRYIKYYNLAGMASDVPYEGINIRVTTYSDGSKQATKVLYR